jgi:hypothetical protein
MLCKLWILLYLHDLLCVYFRVFVLVITMGEEVRSSAELMAAQTEAEGSSQRAVAIEN